MQDGTEPVLYLNGVQQTLTFGTATDKTKWFYDLVNATNAADKFTIGNRRRNGVNYKPHRDGIYSFSIYNTALTATEAKELYSGVSASWKHKGSNGTNLQTVFDSSHNYISGGDGVWQKYGTPTSCSTDSNGKLTVVGDSDNDGIENNSNLTLVKGKTYVISFDFVRTSGTPQIRVNAYPDGEEAGDCRHGCVSHWRRDERTKQN